MGSRNFNIYEKIIATNKNKFYLLIGIPNCSPLGFKQYPLK